jgi:hypothetical protein
MIKTMNAAKDMLVAENRVIRGAQIARQAENKVISKHGELVAMFKARIAHAGMKF